MFVVHDTLGDWQSSPFKHDSAEEALEFFDDIHQAYYNHYRIVEVVNGEARETYIYEEFKKIFD